MSDDVVKSSKSRKKNRFLSWLRFRGKKLAVKTVPVDTASPEKFCRSTEIEEIPVPVPDQTVNNKPRKVCVLFIHRNLLISQLLFKP